MDELVKSLGQVKIASRKLANLTARQKNDALLRIAQDLTTDQKCILDANQLDIDEAIHQGMSAALVDRLKLDSTRWNSVISDLRKVVELHDPVGKITERKQLSNGLKVYKQSVPLGVIAVVYEARPNVTVDVVGLALKSGNAVVLRGGKETIRTNLAIVSVIKNALIKTTIPEDAILFIDDPDRGLLLQMMEQYDFIDMLIPRGGAGLHKFCRENSMIPVITGGIGICHLFVDETTILDKALNVIRNAKIQRPTVCNALDTVLVHKHIADIFIPRLVEKLRTDGVSFRVDRESVKVIPAAPDVIDAGPDDFDTEWLSLVLGIKVVDNLEEAIEHIQAHSTGHSDGILTEDKKNARIFVQQIDSAAVYVNASTRFTDGSALGLGAEIAISTQKLHARGPMALEELTSYKWVISGDYNARQ